MAMVMVKVMVKVMVMGVQSNEIDRDTGTVRTEDDGLMVY